MKSKLAVGFVYDYELFDKFGQLRDKWSVHNLFPTQGMNHLLDSAIGGGNQVVSWYVGLFAGNYTPVITDTMATFPASANELTAYSETTRVLLSAGSAVAGTIDNTADVAIFTFTAPVTIYGGFITSSLSKGAATGVLLSAARFPSPKSGDTGNVLRVSTGCSLINV